MNQTKQSILIAAGIIVVAAVGSLLVALGQPWFAAQQTPSQWPPDFLFPVLWSAIYLIAFFALHAAQGSNPKKLYLLAAINGICNILWCLVFFTLHQTFWGAVVIILNQGAAILYVAELFRKNSAWAYPSLLYPLWIGIATAPNIAVWILQ